MISQLEIGLRLFFGALSMLMAGTNLWQYITSTPDRSRPWVKHVFLIFALINLFCGVFLIVSVTSLIQI